MAQNVVSGESKPAAREPCVHDSRRLDGYLDPHCRRCGAEGYWEEGQREAEVKIHPSGKVLVKVSGFEEPEPKMRLKVVVSGHPLEVAIPPSWTVVELIGIALQSAGIRNPDTREWDLRRDNGTKLGRGARLRETPDIAGTTLFLDPEVGAGV